ncbi:MAG TPA: hypothetical protein H9740_08760 [Candidatus Hungatella pullicola]|nr:hypothetical protein [Candidatus Hungatella pullicola]
MESVKHKLGILFLVLCLLGSIFLLWHLMDQGLQTVPPEGTLVESFCEKGRSLL